MIGNAKFDGDTFSLLFIYNKVILLCFSCGVTKQSSGFQKYLGANLGADTIRVFAYIGNPQLDMVD